MSTEDHLGTPKILSLCLNAYDFHGGLGVLYNIGDYVIGCATTKNKLITQA